MQGGNFCLKRLVAAAALIAGASHSFAQDPASAPAPVPEPATLSGYQRIKNNLYEAKRSLFRRDEVVQSKATTLRQEIQLLFKNFDCQLPPEVQARIKVTNPDGFIPPDLDTRLFPVLTDLPKYTAIKGQSAAAALASVQFTSEDGKPVESVRLKSAGSYATLNPFGLIDKSSDAVIYTMDCSGYLSSSFNLDIEVPAASMKTFAKGQTAVSRSLSVAQATVTSPVIAALFPNSVPPKLKLSDRERLELLLSAVTEIDFVKPAAKDTLTFEVPRELKLLWASNKGRSSAQGSAGLQGGGGAGIGVASVKATAEVGGAISREMSFDSFETYLIQDPDVQKNTSATYGALRNLVIELVADAATSSPGTLNAGVFGNRFEASFKALTPTVCAFKWKSDPATSGAVATRWDQDADACIISFKPATGWSPTETVKLKVNGLAPRTPELALTLDMPILGKL